LPSRDHVNRGVVELEIGGRAGISVRIAEDLAKLVNGGATRRILPVIGTGGLQNITDLKLLRGIDVAILQTDVLDYAKQLNLFPVSSLRLVILRGCTTIVARALPLRPKPACCSSSSACATSGAHC